MRRTRRCVRDAKRYFMIRNRLISKAILGLVFLLFITSLSYAQGSDRVVKATGYVSVDAIRPGDKFKVAVAVEVGEGYHINAHRPTLDFLIPTTLALGAPAGITFAEERYPAPKHRKFEFSPDTELAVHEGTIYVTADVEAGKAIQQGTATIRALVTVQACNDSQCLAPADLAVEIPIKLVAAKQQVKPANADIFARAATAPPDESKSPDTIAAASGPGDLKQFQGSAQKNAIAESIATHGLVFTLLVVFVSGLALNATPCVYPIIPITIGFFVNQGATREGKPNLGRTFSMAMMYVLGMAVTYSVLGVIASLSKGLFGAALQNPVVLIGLAGLMVALALSMFGVYEFRLPESLNR